MAHQFKQNDRGEIEHSIDGELRATIAKADVASYRQGVTVQFPELAGDEHWKLSGGVYDDPPPQRERDKQGERDKAQSDFQRAVSGEAGKTGGEKQAQVGDGDKAKAK